MYGKEWQESTLMTLEQWCMGSYMADMRIIIQGFHTVLHR